MQWGARQRGLVKGGADVYTQNDGGKDEEADALDEDVQAPARQALLELGRAQLQAADEEDEGDGAVQDAVLGADGASVGGDI